MTSDCYTWDRECLDIPQDACAVQVSSGPGSCPKTEDWFWILTAGLTAFLVFKRKQA